MSTKLIVLSLNIHLLQGAISFNIGFGYLMTGIYIMMSLLEVAYLDLTIR
jgi:hypothetical protein